MKRRFDLLLAVIILVPLMAYAATKITQAAIVNSTINSTTIGATTPSTIVGTTITGTTVNATSGFQVNGLAPNGHTLCGNGTNYIDNSGPSCTSTTQVDYYWTAAGCTTGTGQPVHCTATTTLPGNMPDASYQIFCQSNVVSFSGSPPDLHCSLESTYPLPTTAGSTITFDSVQTMQNGGGGGTSEMYFHAHHN